MSDCEDDVPESEYIVHELAPKPDRVWFHDWMEEHFDVLSDLYIGFKRDGEKVFGRSFNQFGTFVNYVEFVFTYTVLQPSDLLKVKTGSK